MQSAPVRSPFSPNGPAEKKLPEIERGINRLRPDQVKRKLYGFLNEFIRSFVSFTVILQVELHHSAKVNVKRIRIERPERAPVRNLTARNTMGHNHFRELLETRLHFAKCRKASQRGNVFEPQ